MGRMTTTDKKKTQFTRKVVCTPCTPLKEHVTDESYEENGKPSAGRYINRFFFPFQRHTRAQLFLFPDIFFFFFVFLLPGLNLFTHSPGNSEEDKINPGQPSLSSFHCSSISPISHVCL